MQRIISARLSLLFVLFFVGQSFAQRQDPSLNNFSHPADYVTAKPFELGKVKKSGSGKIPMILIPGFGYGAEIFDDFVAVNKKKYTMYAVTLPGYGNTPGPAMPAENISFGERTWFRNAEKAILNLVEKEKLRQPVLLTHNSDSGQIAIDLVLDNPDKFSSLIAISAEPHRVYWNKTQTVKEPRAIPMADRVKGVDTNLAPKWFKTVTKQTFDQSMFQPSALAVDEAMGKLLFDLRTPTSLQVSVRYMTEFYAFDRSEDMKNLKVPVLALIPGFDTEFHANPQNSFYRDVFENTWKIYGKLSPQIEVNVVEGVRMFMWKDNLRLVNSKIETFIVKVKR